MPGQSEGRVDELSLLLGGIKQQLIQVANAQAEDRIAAAVYRTDVRKDIKELREDVRDVQGNLNSVTTAVTDISPKVNMLEQQRLMSVGAQRLAVLLAKGAHFLSAAIGGAMVWFLDYMSRR